MPFNSRSHLIICSIQEVVYQLSTFLDVSPLKVINFQVKYSRVLFVFSEYSDFTYKPLQRVNPDVIQELAQNHPDRELVNYVVEGFRYGFKLGLTSQPEPRGPVRNSAKVRKFPHIAQQLVDEEVKKGHILGPFDEPPIPDLVYSPINIVPKAGSDTKFRLVHDLSFAPEDLKSVNQCIPDYNAKVKYHHIDEVIDMALEMGKNTCGARVDVRHAFRNLGIFPEDLKNLAFTLNGKIYLNSSLPFRSSLIMCNF